jgi:hypothetical protein
MSYAYAAFFDYTAPMNGFKSVLMSASMILCPPRLLFTFCIACEVIGVDGFIMYSIIGVLNMALYAVIGAIVAGLRNRFTSAQPQEQKTNGISPFLGR